jgi:hypothetical protein
MKTELLPHSFEIFFNLVHNSAFKHALGIACHDTPVGRHGNAHDIIAVGGYVHITKRSMGLYLSEHCHIF